jgi:hypothetical protein
MNPDQDPDPALSFSGFEDEVLKKSHTIRVTLEIKGFLNFFHVCGWIRIWDPEHCGAYRCISSKYLSKKSYNKYEFNKTIKFY